MNLLTCRCVYCSVVRTAAAVEAIAVAVALAVAYWAGWLPWVRLTP